MLHIIMALLGSMTGQATYYDPGVFEQVWANRTLAQCVECVGYAAMVDCSYLDRRIWITYNTDTVGPLHVIDCANVKDVPLANRRQRIVEVDYWLAMRWHMAGPVPVTVHFHDPRRQYEDSYQACMREMREANRPRMWRCPR